MSCDHADLGESALLERARSGSDGAYRELVEVYRAELHAHCYRILGSVQDAEDALQDALLRAWRGLAGFEGRSSLRSWLYKITTNAALDVAQRRSKREAWRHIATRANGRLALGCYTFDPHRRRWVASVLDVLTLDGDHIAEVTGFVTAELLSRWGEEDDRFVGATVFPRFGLPAVLPG